MHSHITSNRYVGLDLAKYICSLMIICIHMSYAGKAYIEPLTRVAVPVFFMISGYFYSSVHNNGKALPQIKKTLKLLVWSSFLYLIWILFVQVTTGQSISDYFRSFLSPRLWVFFLFFNDSPFFEHLWYIHALIYILGIIFVYEKHYSRSRLYKLIPFFLLFNILATYSTIFLRHSIPIEYSRNFLFVGLPFFLLGDYFNQEKVNIKNSYLIAIMLISVFTTELENIFLMSAGLRYNGDCFISTIFLASSFFLWFIKNEEIFNKPITASVASMCRKTVTTIYVIHPIIIYYFGKIIDSIGEFIAIVPKVYSYIAPFVILLISTSISFLMIEGKQKIKAMFCR